jgi:hypothetical protein
LVSCPDWWASACNRSVRITAESIDELIDDGTIPADRDHDGDDDREDE